MSQHVKYICSGSCLRTFLVRSWREITHSTQKLLWVDENDTNYCTIRQIFYLDFMTSEVVKCQMPTRMTLIWYPRELGLVLEILSKVFAMRCVP